MSAPPKGYIFERMLNAGISFFNYGEALAGLSPLPDKDKTGQEEQVAEQVIAHSDVGLVIGSPPPLPNACYDSDLSNSTVLSQGPGPGLRLLAAARRAGRLALALRLLQGPLPAPARHQRRPDLQLHRAAERPHRTTNPGRRTPTAQIATNDWAMGQIVDEISHSSIWGNSLILVQEDDSQDGADHVDAHRIPALAISPYAKKGAVIHTRYDQISILRTAELVIGLRAVNLAEALAVPLYDAFTHKPRNAAPYNAITPKLNMTATNTAKTPAAKESAGVDLTTLDQVSQQKLDGILWRYIHGPNAVPPPPGPNASSSDADPGGHIAPPRVRAGYARHVEALTRRYRQDLAHR